jgi:hypothetical protein
MMTARNIMKVVDTQELSPRYVIFYADSNFARSEDNCVGRS